VYSYSVKYLLRVLIVVFALLSLTAFFRSTYLARNLYVQSGERTETLNYHFALYLPDNRNTFFTGIIEGAKRAADELNAVISVHSIEPARNELEMAAFTGVDGAIVCPYLDDALARRQLERLGTRQIPVVLINHNVPNDQPWPFIGTNNFDVGRRIGGLADRVNSSPVRLMVVYSDKVPGMYGERELIEMGIATALGERLDGQIMTARTGLSPLDAEELLYRLFRVDQDINTIMFTDSNDTIAAAQTLIDMNLVGRIQVIGFGDDPVIQEHIRKGVITCSIVINPDKIGYEAVRSLVSIRTTGYTSNTIDTGITIIDGSSLP
jgi:ribose transport system substrate-binding protein